MDVIDNISADTIEAGDQIIVDGDPIEVTHVDNDREDIDEILVRGFSHDSGDTVEYPLYADDYYDVWTV